MSENGYKILAVERLILRNPNGISTNEIIKEFRIQYGIAAERKGIYSNIATLTRFLPINKRNDEHKNNIYFLDVKERV